ncbi:MAG TPA: DUF695 domain-containing protein [Kofleriaceae bacterium]
MSENLAIKDRWDFYPCRVDDAPASIFLNMWFATHAPYGGADTLYWVAITMRDPGDHGMGTAEEADQLFPVEDTIADRATAAGLTYVGRLRNRGTWQLTFYGRPEHEAPIVAIVSAVGLGGRAVEVDSIANPDWDYYRTFLLPDRERHRWMVDRAVVDALANAGDPLAASRRVDHWCYFAKAADRDAFVDEANGERFELQGLSDDAMHGAQIHRVDSVELESIHETVMSLVELAAKHHGEYDGWETSVESA